jgi:hypothetical protein
MDYPGEQLPALHLGFLTGTFPSNITNINATEAVWSISIRTQRFPNNIDN